MMFSTDEILELTQCIKSRLSEKRFKHTLSVLAAATKIGRYFVDIDPSELSAAALLHDVTKELSYEDQISILTEGGVAITDEDKETAAILHSLSAPLIVRRDFSKFATDSVLSAVEKHTTGSENMSIFDKIIFIADYVEDLRTYDSCIAVREQLFSNLSADADGLSNEIALDKSVYQSLIFTENDLIKRGRTPNSRSIKAKNALTNI